MPDPKGNSLNDRLANAAKARAAALEKLRAMPKPNDPVMIQRQAELQAIAAAREARQAERVAAAERAAKEEAERLAAAEAARIAEEQRLAAETAKRQAELEAAQKAARDARYAARKKNKKKR